MPIPQSLVEIGAQPGSMNCAMNEVRRARQSRAMGWGNGRSRVRHWATRVRWNVRKWARARRPIVRARSETTKSKKLGEGSGTPGMERTWVPAKSEKRGCRALSIKDAGIGIEEIGADVVAPDEGETQTMEKSGINLGVAKVWPWCGYPAHASWRTCMRSGGPS